LIPTLSFGCAIGGKADFIVSGDKDLTTLKIYRNIPILTPADFLLILNPPAERPADFNQP
jgi:predicted nucleic acid-binding protein